jgi:hypothetical protein
MGNTRLGSKLPLPVTRWVQPRYIEINVIRSTTRCGRNQHQQVRGKPMARVSVKIGSLTADWAAACRNAVTHLNAVFRTRHIKVVLEANGSSGPAIAVKTDASILGNAVHGRTTSEFNTAGGMLRAEIRLPVSVAINTPSGQRNAGPGILEVIVGHELIHALGHDKHNSHLMAQTMQKEMGDRAAQDRLRAGTIYLPPLSLSDESVRTLQSIWA